MGIDLGMTYVVVVVSRNEEAASIVSDEGGANAAPLEVIFPTSENGQK
jgi:molecular chaperone DnaK (HSP70)